MFGNLFVSFDDSLMVMEGFCGPASLICVILCRSRGLPQRGDVGHVMQVSGVKASFEDAEDGEAGAITEIDGLLVQKQGKSMPWLSPLRDCVAEKESKEVG